MITWLVCALTALCLYSLVAAFAVRAIPTRWIVVGEGLYLTVCLAILAIPFLKPWAFRVLPFDEGGILVPLVAAIACVWALLVPLRNCLLLGVESYGDNRLLADSRIAPDAAVRWLMDGLDPGHSMPALALSPFLSEPFCVGVLHPTVVLPSHWFPPSLLEADVFFAGTESVDESGISRDFVLSAFLHEAGHFALMDGPKQYLRFPLLLLLPHEIVYGRPFLCRYKAIAGILNRLASVWSAFPRARRLLQESGADDWACAVFPAAAMSLRPLRAQRRFDAPTWLIAAVLAGLGSFTFVIISVLQSILPSFPQISLSVGLGGKVVGAIPEGWRWEPWAGGKNSWVAFEPATRHRPVAIISSSSGFDEPRGILSHEPSLGGRFAGPGEKISTEWEYEVSSRNADPFVVITLAVAQIPGNVDNGRVLSQVAAVGRLSDPKTTTTLPNGRRRVALSVAIPEGLRMDMLSLTFAHGSRRNLDPRWAATTTCRIFAPKVWRIHADGTRELLP